MTANDGARARPAATDGNDRALLAVEGPAAEEDAVRLLVAALRARREVVEPPFERALGRPPTPRVLLVVPVASAEDAMQAVRTVLAGFSLLVVARGGRDLMDRLYDDLRRFGRLDIRSVVPRDPAASLDPEQRSLLRHLAGGLTHGEAAAALHISRRTADRRLAAARRSLGVGSTVEAVARLRLSHVP